MQLAFTRPTKAPFKSDFDSDGALGLDADGDGQGSLSGAGATEGPMLRVLVLGTLVTLAVALVSAIAGPRDRHSHV